VLSEPIQFQVIALLKSAGIAKSCGKALESIHCHIARKQHPSVLSALCYVRGAESRERLDRVLPRRAGDSTDGQKLDRIVEQFCVKSARRRKIPHRTRAKRREGRVSDSRKESFDAGRSRVLGSCREGCGTSQGEGRDERFVCFSAWTRKWVFVRHRGYVSACCLEQKEAWD
jgi:hypothetical protein